MNNRKLNMLIRFTLEIFLVYLLVSGINAHSTRSQAAEAPKEERQGDRPAAGVEVARLTLNASSVGARVCLRNQELSLTDPNCLQKLAAQKPDQMVIDLAGSPEWQRLLNYALQNDLPISIEVKD
jgi:hypothetical protein